VWMRRELSSPGQKKSRDYFVQRRFSKQNEIQTDKLVDN
jgi:hypothetical protein